MRSNGQSGLSKKKLFIYIPSFNRPNALKMQLAALSVQVAKHNDHVRVLVSDNATPNDAYAELEKQFATDDIVFRKNPGNIDGNANIALGFAFARQEEFLWILSDNDIVTVGALDYLLAHANNEFDFIYFDPDIQNEFVVQYDWTSGWEAPLNGLGLISAGMYNMQTVFPCVRDAFFYHNSSFPHLAVAFSTARYHSRVKFLIAPRHFVLGDDIRETEGDYSLSMVGMPLLSLLMPPEKARSFCWDWLSDRGEMFLENRMKQEAVFLQTVAILKNHGLKFRLLLMWISVKRSLRVIVQQNRYIITRVISFLK